MSSDFEGSHIWVTPIDLRPPRDGNAIREAKIGDTTISVSVHANSRLVHIASVRTPQSKRKRGSARAAMKALLRQADTLGLEVELAASPLDARTSLGRLYQFYCSLGFEPTGRSCNALGHPVMIRPSPCLEQAAQSADDEPSSNDKVTATSCRAQRP